MRRVFVAVRLADAAEARLAEYSGLARSACPGASFPKGRHVTLVFLGDKTDAQVDGIRAHLSTVKESAFGATLAGNGFFPSESFPHVFWVGVESTGLARLQAAVARALGSIGAEFSPHITIARIRTREQALQLREFSKTPFHQVSFRVAEFSLFESFLEPDGARHAELASFQLGNV